MSAVEAIRDFVLQIEKSLAARRLYHPTNAAYQEASERLLEKCRTAAGDDGFTLTITATDLFVEKLSILSRPKHDDSFFFPLFRDGLRELTFTPDVTAEDLSALLDIMELKDRDLGPGGDTVNQLRRRHLTAIQHKAIDGIGDTDFHYDATTLRRTFEENPSVLRLETAEAEEIRAQLGDDRDQELVERFIEILLVIVRAPLKSIEPAAIAPVFQQLAEGYWNARDYARVITILRHVHAAATEAPNPDYRAALADVIRRFLTTERLTLLMLDFIGGALPTQSVVLIWDLVPDEVVWPILLDAWSRLPDGQTRGIVLNALRKRIATTTDLLRSALASSEVHRVRAALALLDEKFERLFAGELIGLTRHSEETVRIKGLAAAARLGGQAALEALWKAVQSDDSKSVRLYAFRAMSTVNWPELPARLKALVTDAQFAARPLWEREKYVQLLGEIGGPAVAPLFESWLPSKRWMWTQKDLEILSLALRGLGATGAAGLETVQKFAAGGGKPAEIARKVLDSVVL